MSELISVIVPVYKVEKYLNRCVNSIINQTYRELEILLVDDGSPDRCGDLCEEYSVKDDRIHVIHKINGGLSSARNAALEIVTGKYVCCVDSDDYIHPDMIRRLYDAAINSDADIAVCSHYEEIKDKLVINGIINDETVIWNREDALEKLIEDKELRNYAWGKLYRTELFDDVRYPDGRNYEDIATTYLLVAKARKIVKIPDYLYYYIIRDDSISYNSSAVSWHIGCHATCLGQEERCLFLKEKGYDKLYEKAMAELLPYLYSDIRSGYLAKQTQDVLDTQKYIDINKEAFRDNALISEKDKKLLSVYLKGEFSYNLFLNVKKIYSVLNDIKNKIKNINKTTYKFELDKDKKYRVVYFELPCFDNLGDHAIAYSTEKLLEDFCNKNLDFQLFIVDEWDTPNAINGLKKCIGTDDCIICQGGGNFGNLYDFAEVFRRKILNAFCNNKIIIMPQTLFYTADDSGNKELSLDKKAVDMCKDLTIYARDSKSYELMKAAFKCDIEQMHDVVSMLDLKIEHENKRQGIVVCLRSDKESALNSEDKKSIIKECEKVCDKVLVTDTCTKSTVNRYNRENVLRNKFKLWSSSKLIVTDRLHGMIFAIITGTPCIVIGNDHHKVAETYRTFEECGYIKYLNKDDDLQRVLSLFLENGDIDCRANVYTADFGRVIERITNNK